MERKHYSITQIMAADLCIALGLDPHKTMRLQFDWRADDPESLYICVEILPDYSGLPETFKPVEIMRSK